MNTPSNIATASTHRFHESATAQVQGRASYIDDLPLVEGTLHAAPLMSPVANAQLIDMDLSATLAFHDAANLLRVGCRIRGRHKRQFAGLAANNAPAVFGGHYHVFLHRCFFPSGPGVNFWRVHPTH